MSKRGGCGITSVLMFLIVVVIVLIGIVGYLYLKDSWVANRISQIDTKKIRNTVEKSRRVYDDQISPYSKKIGAVVKDQVSKVPVTNIKRSLAEKTSSLIGDTKTNVKAELPSVQKKTTSHKPVSAAVARPPVTTVQKQPATKKKTATKTKAASSSAKTITAIKPSIPTKRNVIVYLTKYIDAENAFSLVSVTRSAVSSSAPLEDALKTLLQGTTEAEDSKGLTTAIPGGVQLKRVIVSNGVAKINYTSQFEAGSGKALMQARIYQVVYTATEFSTVNKVLILIEGKPVSDFAGQKIDLRFPLGRIGFTPRFKDS